MKLSRRAKDWLQVASITLWPILLIAYLVVVAPKP